MGLFGSKTKSLVGLDIGSSSVKVCELEQIGKGTNIRYRLQKLGQVPLPSDAIVDGDIMDSNAVAAAIRQVLAEQKIKAKEVAISLSGQQVMVKKVTFPLMSQAELAESVRWEAESFFPAGQGLDSYALDYYLIEERAGEGNMDVVLVACRKDKLEAYVSCVAQAGCSPKVVDVDVFAVQNAYEINYEPSSNHTVALLDIGASTMTIHIVSGTEFLFTRDVAVGGHQYTEFIQKEFNLNYSQAQSLKHGEKVDAIDPADARRVIDSVTEIICLEIQKTYDFFRTTTTVDHIDRMIVSGGAAHTPGLIEALSKKFEIPAEKFDSFRRISFDPQRFSAQMIADRAPDLAIAIGLALRSDEE